MNSKMHIRATLIGAMCALSMVTIYAPQSDAAADSSATPRSATVRDGSHDFDFIYGKWRMPNHFLKKRLTGSHEWVDFVTCDEGSPLPGASAISTTGRRATGKTLSESPFVLTMPRQGFGVSTGSTTNSREA
jgi:hypothetical protein